MRAGRRVVSTVVIFFFPWAQLRTRHQTGQSHCVGVLQVGIDGRDHDARFDRDQVDADQGNSNPGVDHDAFIQDSIQYINQTGTAGNTFNCHANPPANLSP